MSFMEPTPKEYLSALRKRAGLTQRELAAAIGISHPSYAYYESARFKLDHLPNKIVNGLMEVLLGRGEPPISRDEIMSLAERPPEQPHQNMWHDDDLPTDPSKLIDELNNIDRQTTHAIRRWLATRPDAPPEIVQLHVKATTCRQMIARSFS